MTLPLCAGLLSFGGICVLLQVAALSGKIPLKAFLLSRVPAAAMAALFALPAVFVPQVSVPAISDGASVGVFSSGGLSGFCILVMCGILLAQEKAAPQSGRSGR